MSTVKVVTVHTYQYNLENIEDEEINALAEVIDLLEKLGRDLPDGIGANRNYRIVRELYRKLRIGQQDVQELIRAEEEPDA